MSDIIEGVEDLGKLNIEGLMEFLDKIGNAAYTFEHHAEIDCNPFSKQDWSDKFGDVALDESKMHHHSFYHNYYQSVDDFKDLWKAREEYHQGNWGMMGYYIGQTASQLTLVENTDDDSVILRF